MSSIAPGTVVAVDFILFKHVGIYTGCGTVISNSRARGGVYEETLSDFGEGRRVEVVGFYGNLPGSHVVNRARSLVGHGWNFFNFNCEHFASWAHGLEAQSPQLRAAATILGFAVALAAVSAMSAGRGRSA